MATLHRRRNTDKSSAIESIHAKFTDDGRPIASVNQWIEFESLDDEHKKYNRRMTSYDEAEKLLEISRANAEKRKRMGYASTKQLRYIESLTGKKQDRSMKASEASKIIKSLK